MDVSFPFSATPFELLKAYSLSGTGDSDERKFEKEESCHFLFVHCRSGLHCVSSLYSHSCAFTQVPVSFNLLQSFPPLYRLAVRVFLVFQTLHIHFSIRTFALALPSGKFFPSHLSSYSALCSNIKEAFSPILFKIAPSRSPIFYSHYPALFFFIGLTLFIYAFFKLFFIFFWKVCSMRSEYLSRSLCMQYL